MSQVQVDLKQAVTREQTTCAFSLAGRRNKLVPKAGSPRMKLSPVQDLATLKLLYCIYRYI